MLNVPRNQQSWKKWLQLEDDQVVGILERAAERLNWAWAIDEKYPKSYPINTSHAFGEIEREIRHRGEARKLHKLPPPAPPPETLGDLLSESTIRTIYEDQNEGTYKDALRRAADFGGGRYWRKIRRAVDAAYLADYYGVEFAPRPRVHFLHRNLLKLADASGLRGLTREGLRGFFDELCPCGRRHTTEAIRKLIGRRSRARKGPKK